MTKDHSFVLGAVAYDPKVVTIWEGFRQYFAARGFAFDFVLYTHYERQVEAHLRGDFDVAWNSPLSWLEAQRYAVTLGRRVEAIAMRDSDRDLTSVVLVRADGPVKSVTDLKGRIVAVGASDSPQATLIPLEHLATQGVLAERDFTVLRHDVMVGKHGDHVGGERDAVRALINGDADAACVIDGNHLSFVREGLFAQGSLQILTQTAPYDHCNMTVLESVPPARCARFRELLLGMSFDDPEARPLLEMEGLRQWLDGRDTGYTQLAAAIDRFDTIAPWLARVTG
ncbi:MAG: PhnD/SsuA/transferrin family substrate-binding protein [Deltaproteobacteria bacterium]|nr:PhnD/SsuA/transferrin family substrate-binding protein [Deltaproteobacteria bacterium]